MAATNTFPRYFIICFIVIALPLYSLANICGEGSLSAFATGDAALTFGATSDGSCAQFCVPEMALGFIPNVAAGSCADQGFPEQIVATHEVELPGSPMPISVAIYESETSEETETSAEMNQWDYTNPSSYEGPCVDCEDYVGLTGEEKLDRIWSKIMAHEYRELPNNWLHKRTNPTQAEMLSGFPDPSRVNMIFDRVSDERPPNFPRLLHEYGSIAKIAFEPKPGNNFTGLYSEGNKFGIIRITFCAPVSGEQIGLRVPLAFAAKFFRDGIHSSNIPTCEGPDYESDRNPEDFGVFQYHHVLHTSVIIPPPIDAFFANAQNGTGSLSIADNTWYNHDGTRVEDPLSPLIIHFFPNHALNTKDTYDEDFRKELPAIPSNTTLYTAYTPVDEEGNPTICICHSTPDGDIPCFDRDPLAGMCNLVELGSIVTRSQFVHSDYGDNGILFKHQRSCQEDRKYCKYSQPVPEVDSTFTKSSDPNGTCVSRRRVDNYDACPFMDGVSAIESMELLGSSDYCSTPDEHNLEKMCPFAQALHPSFSSAGVQYPLTKDDHLRNCDILNTDVAVNTKSNGASPIVSQTCCHVINQYFDSKDMALRSLCNMDNCYVEFGIAFPQVNLGAECSNVELEYECKFELPIGSTAILVTLGFVSKDCCAAAEAHTSGGDTLDSICMDKSCAMAYDSLFQQGQAFANPGSTDTLEDVCMAMEPMSSTEEEEETEEEKETGPLIPSTSDGVSLEKNTADKEVTTDPEDNGIGFNSAASLPSKAPLGMVLVLSFAMWQT